MADSSWLADLLGTELPAEGGIVTLGTSDFVMRGGILRANVLASAAQAQTGSVFGFKWQKRDTYDSPGVLDHFREWITERYGDMKNARWFDDYGARPVLLDAGCGSGFSALELFGERLRDLRYLGVDISEAVDVAVQRFCERGLDGAFMQADLLKLMNWLEKIELLLFMRSFLVDIWRGK